MSTAITTDTISGFFEKLGWSFRVIDSTRVLTNYRCPVPAFYYVINVEIILGEYWVTFRSLLQNNVSRGQLAAVQELISQWNKHAYRARYLLVDGCVILQIEMPKAHFDYAAFVDSLVAICRYGRLSGVEMAAAATNPSLAKQIDLAVAAEAPPAAWEAILPTGDEDLNFDISMNRLPDGTT
ncbi:hypothetical protein R8Z50_12230 [Longispora sp. K20-0274]|uniref:hypothetical protein n=1 Tax=Longispora sp. K20-0274 TaxID=3088255 RepID=UPI00399B03FB